MFPIQILIALLASVAVVALLAERLKLPYPILMVVGGLAMSFIPGLPRVQLRPEIVFLVILPPLLYYAGLLTTWRDFRANLRPILFLAIGLVLATTLAVAAAAHALIPDLPWAAALALGAIVSPPDALAVTSITDRLGVPRRIVTILEGESLVNDATALVAYRFAVAAVASGGAFSLSAASVQFVWVAAGGIAIGLAVGFLAAWLTCLIRQPGVAGTLSLLTPFTAYLPAEGLHVSGVLAVVTAGVVMSRRLPLVATAQSRLRDFAVWDTLLFILNGLVFILIGLQLPSIMERLEYLSFNTLCLYAVSICGAAILVRIAWVFAVAYLTRALLPAIRKRDPMPPWQHVAIVSWAGMRGVVSLAAALALPHTFPGRDLIIFLAFSVIMATLVIQGLTLPLMIRLLRVRGDDLARVEEHEARIEAAHAALSRLTALSFDESINPEVLDRFRISYVERLATLGARPRDGILPEGAAALRDPAPAKVQREALVAERRMITFLRDQEVISDSVLRKLLHEIDLEEARLSE